MAGQKGSRLISIEMKDMRIPFVIHGVRKEREFLPGFHRINLIHSDMKERFFASAKHCFVFWRFGTKDYVSKLSKTRLYSFHLKPSFLFIGLFNF